jgi:glucose/arabinose dehydrogenase
MHRVVFKRSIYPLFSIIPLRFLITIIIIVITLASWPGSSALAADLPPGFQESIAFSGLDTPTVVRFSPDGRVFVAEKRGVIKVFDSLNDPTPDVFADLNVNVYNFWDRGLLGMALDPNFPTNPYVYVLYAYDAEIGGQAPKYGTPGVYSDPCPDPPGATNYGCVISARLSRLTAKGNFMTGSEKILINDWCQQYPSHSIGSLAFGPDGALYASGGEGADFNQLDYGQEGDPLNPCGDPPGGVGSTLTPPTAEGGALRSQDLRTGGDPVSLDGTVIRVDPATGAGLPDNPLAGNPDLNARRIIAYGLRNPFRLAFRPGSQELWTGDVGWFYWEEINRIGDVNDGTIENFGWPCYEGKLKQDGYDSANLNLCENLYNQAGAVTKPFYTYYHDSRIVPNEACPPGSSSISGLAFQLNSGSPYPSQYNGALFFSDYSRNCIWAMLKGSNGLPDPATITTFISNAASPVDLVISPAGELFYVDLNGGTIRRVRYFSANQPPTAVIATNKTSGIAPLTVNFDGSGSSDPNPGDSLTYTWDLDGDGKFDNGTGAQVSYTYTQAGNVTVGLKVTDSQGASDTDTVLISAGNTPPTAKISSPAPGTLWKVGDVINFSGSATDTQDGNLLASRFHWHVVMMHCPANCHAHTIQEFDGVYGGSFKAPDHEYPSYLELRLTATDTQGLQDTKILKLYPKTTLLTLKSDPSGLQLVINGASYTTTFSHTVIVGSHNSVSATTPQTLNEISYRFSSWSDGGTQTHDITAPANAMTLTAHFIPDPKYKLFLSLMVHNK